MAKKVILDEGGSVNVHTRIKDMCKEARNRLGLSNQDIAEAISDRFGMEDFSVNTVNNFFSERSKATTIYTTGYICAVLNISIDDAFGIERKFSTAEEAEFVSQLAALKVENRLKDQEIEHLQKEIYEKDLRIDQAHNALEFYRAEAEKSNGKIPARVLNAVLMALIFALASCIGLIFFK